MAGTGDFSSLFHLGSSITVVVGVVVVGGGGVVHHVLILVGRGGVHVLHH